ncbi:hypothetical protein HT031_006769 [Scenedesmus sp. PABB004]|nr:hypothetical protein HT031_006769 [Scenedesmus sp. PABB004]
MIPLPERAGAAHGSEPACPEQQPGESTPGMQPSAGGQRALEPATGLGARAQQGSSGLLAGGSGAGSGSSSSSLARALDAQPGGAPGPQQGAAATAAGEAPQQPDGGAAPAAAPRFTLFYAKVPRDEGREQLLALFGQYGGVAELEMFMEAPGAAASKGCGLVVYESREAAGAAVEGLNNRFTWPGMRSAMVVKLISTAADKQQPGGAAGRAPAARGAGTSAGAGAGWPGRPGGGGGAAAAAAAAAPEAPPDGCAPGAYKLFVGNVPRAYGEDELRPVFESVGRVVELVVLRDRGSLASKGSAFVWYAAGEHADQAVREFNMRIWLPVVPGNPASERERPLVVRRASGHRPQAWAGQQELPPPPRPDDGAEAWQALGAPGVTALAAAAAGLRVSGGSGPHGAGQPMVLLPHGGGGGAATAAPYLVPHPPVQQVFAVSEGPAFAQQPAQLVGALPGAMYVLLPPAPAPVPAPAPWVGSFAPTQQPAAGAAPPGEPYGGAYVLAAGGSFGEQPQPQQWLAPVHAGAPGGVLPPPAAPEVPGYGGGLPLVSMTLRALPCVPLQQCVAVLAAQLQLVAAASGARVGITTTSPGPAGEAVLVSLSGAQPQVVAAWQLATSLLHASDACVLEALN